MIALAGRFLGPREGAAHHDGIGPAGQRLADIPALAHAAVGDDGHVTAGQLMVIIARGGAIHRGGDLRNAQAEHAAAGAGGPRPDPNQDAGHAAAHQLQGDVVGDRVADENGDFHLAAEFSQLEGFVFGGLMFDSGNGGLDDENIGARLLGNGAKALRPLRNGTDGGQDAGLL